MGVALHGGIVLASRIAYAGGTNTLSENTMNTTRRQLMLAAALGLLPALRAEAKKTPLVLLAREWLPGSSPAGWLVSEKFDGVRALWDGQRLRFRSGREIAAPDGFLARLPRENALDGELWLGRGQFERLSGIVRSRVPDDEAWRALRYQVFELPGAAGSFAQRAVAIERIVGRAAWPALLAVRQDSVPDADALQRRLDALVRAGGEGLMLHAADAPYEIGRSDALRKFKPRQDAEATVIAHQPGRGKYLGQTGALLLRNDDGTRFWIASGLRDADRASPPAIGTRITYTHRGVTADGLPRFAAVLRPAPQF